MNNRTRVLSTKSIDERRYDVFGELTTYDEMVEYGARKAAAREKAAKPIQIVTFEC